MLLVVGIDELLNRYLIILVNINFSVYISCQLWVYLTIRLLNQKPLHLLYRQYPVLIRVNFVEFLLELSHDPLVFPLTGEVVFENSLLVSLFKHQAIGEVILRV